jgi:hypothetical protein
MGNTLSPRYAEFAAEFKRLEAAIAAEEAKPTLDRDAAVLRELNLELLKLKIGSAEVSKETQGEGQRTSDSDRRASHPQAESHLFPSPFCSIGAE